MSDAQKFYLPTPPSTYLHAGAGTGWPHDHKAEDTFDLPPEPTMPHVKTDEEYFPKFNGHGGAELCIRTVTTTAAYKRIATFDTYADAETAAKALNEHKGY